MPLVPWLITLIAALTLIGLWQIRRLSWLVYLLMFIPVVIGGVYAWVWLTEPELAAISRAVRPAIFYSFGVGDYAIYNTWRKWVRP